MTTRQQKRAVKKLSPKAKAYGIHFSEIYSMNLNKPYEDTKIKKGRKVREHMIQIEASTSGGTSFKRKGNS